MTLAITPGLAVNKPRNTWEVTFYQYRMFADGTWQIRYVADAPDPWICSCGSQDGCPHVQTLIQWTGYHPWWVVEVLHDP